MVVSSPSGSLLGIPGTTPYKNRRGYVRTIFTAEAMRADFRILPYVRAAEAPVSTAASSVTEDRVSALHSD